MMHGMTPVEHLDNPVRIQLDLGDNPIQPLPDPRCAVGHERHPASLSSTHPVQMKRHQFDPRIGPLERTVDGGAASPNHAPLLVHLEQDDHLGLAPLDLELLPFPLAADANRLHHGSHSDATTVDPDRNALALELAAGREFPTTEPHEIARAGRQHLCPQLTSDSPDRFLVEFQTLPSQLRARLFQGQQTDQTTHLGLRIGAATLTDAIGRQFGVETASLSESSPAGVPTRGAVQGHHRDRQAIQKADHHGAYFFSTGRSSTSASPITLSMCGTVSGCSLALASSPAT